MATDRETTTGDDPLPVGRFGRILVLIAFVSGVFVLSAMVALPSELESLATVFVGAVAMVTVMVAFLVSVAGYVEE
ncbi:hypothetical protein [Halobacterium wangiae]|uniref:hypothetical protein n=1 Tax=Halobacterium wangiae TaxID=2902623 RepID=UPI001E6049CE|nr:hypothetical protein [Halobacterium wangiae]